MRKLMRRRPSPAMLVAVIALVFALGGTAVAAKKLGLSALSNGAKNKTVGVGKLTYVTTTTPDVSDGFGPNASATASAQCPAGLKVIGGGIKGEDPDSDFIFDSYPTATGWSGRVFANGPGGTTRTFTTTAICAASQVVTGAPPSS